MQKIIKSNTTLSLIIIFAIGLYIHISIGEAIAESLVYVWYAILSLVMIINVLGILYAGRVLITKWHILASEAKIAIAESVKASRDIREFGDKVFQFGIDEKEVVHALHLEVLPYSNGRYAAPTEQQLAVFNMVNQTFNQQNNTYYANEEKQDGVPLLESGMNDNWIDDIVITAPHIHLAGATGSGKTTFAQVIIDKLINTNQGADFWLIDPKSTASNIVWPITPFSDDINTTVSALLKMVDMLDTRRKNTNYNPDIDSNQIIIIDDWDWIFEEHKRAAVSALRMLLKIGRSLNFKVILIGQSVLSGDTGLSRSDYNNTVRVALKHEAYQLLAALKMRTTDKDICYEQLAMAERNNQRYALVKPYLGMPEVKIIPDLTHLITAQQRPLMSAPVTMGLTTNSKELTIVKMLKEGKSLRECARYLTMKEQKLINSADTEKVKRIAQKHNINIDNAQ